MWLECNYINVHIETRVPEEYARTLSSQIGPCLECSKLMSHIFVYRKLSVKTIKNHSIVVKSTNNGYEWKEMDSVTRNFWNEIQKHINLALTKIIKNGQWNFITTFEFFKLLFVKTNCWTRIHSTSNPTLVDPNKSLDLPHGFLLSFDDRLYQTIQVHWRYDPVSSDLLYKVVVMI